MGAQSSKSSNPFRRRPAANKSEDATWTVRLQRPSTAATADSAFFQMLPPELRRLVLIHAFGNRTLHVQFPACVCQRLTAGYEDIWDEDSPGIDGCTREYSDTFRKKTKERRARWMISAMGWLRCCRQAYLEGVEVLYATSTFHVRGDEVNQNPLAQYLPTAHLASVRSLEWVIRPSWLHDPPERGAELVHLKGFLQALPFALPNLQSLYIGFWPCPSHWASWAAFRAASPKEKYLVHTEQILVPVDALISEGLGNRLRELEIGIPLSAFHAHFARGLGLGYKFELQGWTPDAAKKMRKKYPPGQAAWGPRKRIWRPVDQAGETRGYWVGETIDDMPEGWGVTVPTEYWK